MNESRSDQSESDDILEFAAARQRNQKKPNCWTCSIPEREAVDEALRKGAAADAVVGWLIKKKGYSASEPTRHKIKNHRQLGHHER